MVNMGQSLLVAVTKIPLLKSLLKKPRGFITSVTYAVFLKGLKAWHSTLAEQQQDQVILPYLTRSAILHNLEGNGFDEPTVTSATSRFEIGGQQFGKTGDGELIFGMRYVAAYGPLQELIVHCHGILERDGGATFDSLINKVSSGRSLSVVVSGSLYLPSTVSFQIREFWAFVPQESIAIYWSKAIGGGNWRHLM